MGNIVATRNERLVDSRRTELSSTDMDPSLVEYLDRRFDESREELREFRLETSERFDEMREETSKRFDESRVETSKLFDEFREETSKRFDESRAETSKLFDEFREETSKGFDELRVETSTTFHDLKTEIGQLHVLLEDHGNRLRIVAEGVASNDQKITRLRSEMNGQFEDLKGLLYPSIQNLDRRVTDLEAQ